jgi:hypothetical protein
MVSPIRFANASVKVHIGVPEEFLYYNGMVFFRRNGRRKWVFYTLVALQFLTADMISEKVMESLVKRDCSALSYRRHCLACHGKNGASPGLRSIAGRFTVATPSRSASRASGTVTPPWTDTAPSETFRSFTPSVLPGTA